MLITPYQGYGAPESTVAFAVPGLNLGAGATMANTRSVPMASVIADPAVSVAPRPTRLVSRHNRYIVEPPLRFDATQSAIDGTTAF
jgi:hypothetical protein